MKNIIIVGYGKVGSHLYQALQSKYYRNNITLIKNSHSAITANHIAKADIIFICTHDDRIKNAAQKILKTRTELKGKIIVHTSGAMTSVELDSLKKRGAFTASFHPVQTFNKKTNKDTGLFRNIYIAIEGDKKAVSVLTGIAGSIGSVPFKIEARHKTLHHICCVISSNYLVTHFSSAAEIYRQKFGFKNDNFLNIYMPLVQQTLANIKHSGITSSLTGPIERNDSETIRKHIKELETLKSKEIVDYYRFVGLKTVKIAEQKGSINKHQSKELIKLLKPGN